MNRPIDSVLVSVVTPSRNQACFLEETLASVYAQDYRPIEHIVIDASSTDASVDILKRWAETHNDLNYRLKFISEPDRGLGDGVNKGFERAAGQIVGWLNADDVYFDRVAIRSAVDALRSDPSVDAVYGDVALISEDSGLWMIWCFPGFKYKRILRGYVISQPTVFFRKHVTEDIRIDPDLPVAHDVFVWLTAGEKYKFKHLHRVQAGDRDHSKRMTYAVLDTWAARRDEMYRSFGGSERRRLLARNVDRITRILMRIRGAFCLLKLFSRSNWQQGIAFPIWIDSKAQVLKRQATMRILRRPKLIRPTAVKQTAIGSTDG